jgi:GT2 family glycosyltransferase
MELRPQVNCIIVNWNGWQDTVECLTSLKKCTYPNLGITVVDNGSTNDSVAKIKIAHPDILLFENEKNLGFAGGNNIGIRHALAQGATYVWLLNNDTKPDPDALSALIEKALSNKLIGAVGSVCYFADRPDTVQVWVGASVNLWIGYFRNSLEPHIDDWFDALYGASMLIACTAIKDAGMLDEGFFHFLEETELCLRLRKRGWTLAAAPHSRVLHKVGASTGGHHVGLDRYFTASGLRILRLHSPISYLAMLLFLMIRFTRRFLRLQLSQCKYVWAGIQDYRKSSLAQKIH